MTKCKDCKHLVPSKEEGACYDSCGWNPPMPPMLKFILSDKSARWLSKTNVEAGTIWPDCPAFESRGE